MLQKIRDSLQAQKWFAILLLGTLALVFAAWGAYGIVNISMSGGDYAAKVAGDQVSLEQAREAWVRQQAQWQQRMGGDIPAQMKAGLQDQLLEAMIRNVLLTQHAREYGYRISDAQIQEAIRNEPAFQVDGKYSPDAAKARIAQTGLSLAAFEADIRGVLERAQVEDAVRASDFVTAREMARMRTLADEERELRYAVLTPEKFAGAAPVDDAAIEAYFKAHQADYLTQESVRVAYAELRLDQLAAQVTVTDADLHAYYDKTKSRFIVGEKRRAHHILIAAGTDKDADAAALKKAQDILAQARAGKDFEALAKANSQDPGSAAKGGDLGWAERGTFAAPFAAALYSMTAGEIRGPVKTEYGYHIIRLDEIQPAKGQNFEQARGEVEAQLRRDRASDRFGDVQEQLQRRLDQPGADFNAIAKEFQLQTGEVATFVRGAGGAPLGTSTELQEAVFSGPVLDEGHIGGPVLMGEDRLVIVKDLQHRKAAPKPLADVRDSIVAAIRKQRGSVAAVAAAEAGKDKLMAGTSFDEVLKGLGVPADAAHFVGRTDPSVPASIRDAVFRAPKPLAGKPVYRALKLEDGGAAIFAVTGLRTAPGEANKNQDIMRERQAQTTDGMGDVAAYAAEVRRTADVVKNPKAFE